ncbi:MAG: carboxypeptidase-like regulatory domain-containing protein [Clostridia bacterium]
MKKIISIILCVILLLTCVGCEKQQSIEMPLKELPQYPSVIPVDGYSISGKVVDYEGEGLFGASISINGKVKALTDENGNYKIKSLKGTSKISVSFYDYVFKNAERTVNNFSSSVNFEGSSNFAVEAKTQTLNGATLYGVAYDINGEIKRADVMKGLAYKINNQGKTTITPSKNGFTFFPASADLYTGNSGNPIIFTAVPNEETFSVSGTMTFIEASAMPEISIFVNGMKYTNSVISKSNNLEKVTYTISGLPYVEGNGYVITAGSGLDGYISTQEYLINSERTSINFDMYKSKAIDVDLSFQNGSRPQGTLRYIIKVIDKNGKEISKDMYTSQNGQSFGIIVFEGCRVVVESEQFTTEHETITTEFMNNKWALSVSIPCVAN